MATHPPGIEAAIVPQVSARWKPSGKARVAAWGIPAEADLEDKAPPTADVFASWRLFTDALGTHLPNGLNRALSISRAMRDAVR